MGNARRYVDDVAGPERMPLSAIQPIAEKLPSATSLTFADHRSTELQRSIAALHEHHIDDLIVLFGQSIGIAIQQSKAMIAVVGERFAR